MSKSTADETEPTAIARYDPAFGPATAAWNALTDDERLFVVTAWHKKNRGENARVHPETKMLRHHGLQHVLVENMVAAGQPQAMACIKALMAKGLSRHETLHAVGDATTTYILSLATKGEEFADDGFASELERLDPNLYFNTAPDV